MGTVEVSLVTIGSLFLLCLTLNLFLRVNGVGVAL